MPRARDLLERFRPAGAPGGATAAGTPVDHTADMASELAPVFAALAETQTECAQLLDSARADAAATLARAREQANAVRDSARERVPAERTAAAAAAVEAERGRVVSEAWHDKERLDDLLDRGRAAIPAVVEEVVEAVRHSTGSEAGIAAADRSLPS